MCSECVAKDAAAKMAAAKAKGVKYINDRRVRMPYQKLWNDLRAHLASHSACSSCERLNDEMEAQTVAPGCTHCLDTFEVAGKPCICVPASTGKPAPKKRVKRR